MQKQGDSDVLFCIVPSVTLWRPHPYVEPSYAPSLVVGGLEKSGYSTAYVDLNLQLNVWQKEVEQLSRKTLGFLENWQENLLKDPRLPVDLEKLLDLTLSFLDDFSPQHIALALDRITTIFRIFNAQFGFAMALSRRLKEKTQKPIIWGGQIVRRIGYQEICDHIKAGAEPYADYIFFGDGALALPLLIDSLKKEDPNFRSLSEHLSGTCDEVIRWDKTGAYTDLNKSLTSPAPHSNKHREILQQKALLKIRPSFQVLNRDLYHTTVQQLIPDVEPGAWGRKSIAIYPYKFMYGCSHKCAFCKSSNQALVVKPVEKVVDELEYLVEEEGLSSFRFFNAQINFSAKYVKDFCRQIINRKLKIQFSDSASLRNLTPEICDLLREAGCIKLWFGLESPVKRILKLIRKELSLDRAKKALKIAHDAGLWIGGNIIVGFPDESDDEFDEVYQFVEEHLDIVDCWQFSALQVHEGTPMFQHPDDYNIELKHLYASEDQQYGYAFTEKTGLDWKAREERAMKRQHICQQLARPNIHRFHANDYLIFCLYREFNDKVKVKTALKGYLSQIDQTIGLAAAKNWMTPKRVSNFERKQSDQFLTKAAAQ